MGRCRSTLPLSTLSTRFDTELGQLRETARSLEQRLAKLEDTSARAQHDLREQVLEQAKSFLDELHRTREALTTSLGEPTEAPARSPPRPPPYFRSPVIRRLTGHDLAVA